MYFKKVNKHQYFLEDSKELVNKVNEMVKVISGDTSKFIEPSNDNLFQTILSRVVSTEFFKDNELEDDILTVLIDISCNNKLYTISLGKFVDPTDGNVKIIESYYVR